MLTWIKSLLGYTDRATAAGLRVATAWEDIAVMSEAVRDELRNRLGGESRVTALPEPDPEPKRKGAK